MKDSHCDHPAEFDIEALEEELAGRDVAAELDSVEDVLKLIDRHVARNSLVPGPGQEETQGNALATEPAADRIAVSENAGLTGDEQRIGRFRILRPLGQGGYGLVYLAHDTELGREVALKIPRPEAIITVELRTRFLREAKAAALLSHPNIVSVFEAGHVGAVCYIVSHYVQGLTLAEWMGQGRSMNADRAAELVACLADAVQHAHSKGVIHRDLKPANILIEKDDDGRSEQDKNEGGRIKDESEVRVSVPESSDSSFILHPASLRITDFGLAKTLSDSHSLTGTGAVIGTPSYMSPEQAAGAGHSTDATTDVYSLGAILYELLTGRPPFEGNTVLQTLRRVQETDPVSPRKLQSQIPRDLDAICVKCLEKQPARRYLSAAALREDLTRYLQGETVTARPVSLSRRFHKWCLRNPAIAVFSAVFAISAIVALIALTSFWLRSEHHREVAESRSAQLSTSIQSLFDILAASPEIRAPAAEPLRRRVIEQAEQVYAAIVRHIPDDARMQFDQANSIFEVAQILDAMGDVQKAIEKIDEAIAIASNLNEQSIGAGTSEYQTKLGNWLVFKGHLQKKLGDFPAAAESFAAGLAKFEKTQVAQSAVASDEDLQPYMVSGRAHALAQQAMNAVQAKDVTAALEASEQCEEIWRTALHNRSMNDQPDNVRFAIAHSFLILGQVYDVAADIKKSEQLLSQAIDIAESLVSVSVSSQVGTRGILAACYHRYGIALARQDRFDDARAAYHDSLARFDQLVEDFPDVPRYREFQSSARYSLAFTEFLTENYPLARDLVSQNIESHRWLAERFPETAGLYWDRIGDNYGMIAMIIREDPVGTHEDRVHVLQEAISAYDQSLALRPDWKEPVVGWASAMVALAETYREERLLDSSTRYVTEAIARLASIIEPDSDWHDARTTLASAHHEHARLLNTRGQLDLAIQECRQALDVLRHSDTKEVVLELARLLARTGRLDDAEQEIRGYVQDFAGADKATVQQVCREIADELEAETDRQRFRKLAEEWK